MLCCYIVILIGAIEKLIMMDTSYDMVKLCKDAHQDGSDEKVETSFVVADEEFLPFKERCLSDFIFASCQCELVVFEEYFSH